jgi:hypothetical protein
MVPAVIVEGPVRAREKELVIVMAAVPLLDGSATLTAVSETLGGAIRICGAVYIPEESTVPHAAPAQPLPEIIHVTARSGLPAEVNVAEKDREAPRSTGMAPGETEMEMSLVTVTCEAEVLLMSAMLVACTDTETGEGSFTGAV